MVESNDKSLGSGKQTEAGYGVIIVIMLMFFFFVMVFAGVGSSMSSARSQENLLTRQHEKWDAKSGLATLRRVMEVRVPERYQEHIALAKTCLASGGRTESQISAMKPFDEQDTPPSNPVVVVQADGTAVCNTVGAGNFLSFLGNSNAWAQALLPSLEQQARSFGYSTETIKVARFTEQVRRFNQAGEPTYNLAFIIDARGGQHYRVREEGEVLLGNPSENCGATGKLEIAPQTVAQGSPVTFKITYTSVSRLLVTNRAGTVIKDVVTSELSTPQIYTFDYTPAADDSYRVEATAGDSGCFSRSEYVPVAVTVVLPPACPVIDVLNATPGSVQSGETSVVSWSVRNASEVTLDNAVVAGNGSQGFVILADRTFTLTARNSSNTCPATMQVPVKMVATPCAQPTVASFALNPSSVAPGEQVTISWQINNLIAGGRVNITLPDGSVLRDLGASGSRAVAAPGSVGTFNYSINAANPCGTSVADTKPLQVSKAPCVGPTFASFAANPNSVLAGGSSPIQFNWSLSGTVDSVSIDQGIGAVSGNAYTLPKQPQTTTTYTISAVGCGVRQTASSTVVVNIKPNCSTPAVKISANPNVVAPNGRSILSWSAAGMENGGRITISGPNGFSANVQSPPSPASPSGTLPVTLPGIPGDYIYTATALNPCGGGQTATAQTTVRVSSSAGKLETGNGEFFGQRLEFSADPLGCSGFYYTDPKYVFYIEQSPTPGEISFRFIKRDFSYGLDGAAVQCPSRTPRVALWWTESKGYCGNGEKRVRGLRDGEYWIYVNRTCDFFDGQEARSPSMAFITFYNAFDIQVGSATQIPLRTFSSDNGTDIQAVERLQAPVIPAGATKYTVSVGVHTITSLYDLESCGNYNTPNCNLTEAGIRFVTDTSNFVPLQ